MDNSKKIITTKDGKKMQLPPQGSLGLLAIGYRGLLAWREVRDTYIKEQKAKMKAEKEDNNG